MFLLKYPRPKIYGCTVQNEASPVAKITPIRMLTYSYPFLKIFNI